MLLTREDADIVERRWSGLCGWVGGVIDEAVCAVSELSPWVMSDRVFGFCHAVQCTVGPGRLSRGNFDWMAEGSSIFD